MSQEQTGLAIVDGLLFVLLVVQFVRFKRKVDRYRPPSPLPRAYKLEWEEMTVIRVS